MSFWGNSKAKELHNLHQTEVSFLFMLTSAILAGNNPRTFFSIRDKGIKTRIVREFKPKFSNWFSVSFLQSRIGVCTAVNSNKQQKCQEFCNILQVLLLPKVPRNCPDFTDIWQILAQEPIEIDHCIHFLSNKSKHMALKHSDWLETH